MRVSVVTPTMNRPEFLKQAIESFLKQDHKNKEMIIVNDGGTIPEVDHHLITVYNIDHVGQANAMNYGIEKATGDLICTLDDDDLLHDERSLSVRVEEFMLDEMLDFVWSGQIDFKASGELSTEHPVEKDRYSIWNRDEIGINTLMFRKSIKGRIGGYYFDKSLTTNEDWDFKIRCIEELHGEPVEYFTNRHRIHSGMKSNADRQSGEMGRMAAKIFEKLKKVYNK